MWWASAFVIGAMVGGVLLFGVLVLLGGSKPKDEGGRVYTVHIPAVGPDGKFPAEGLEAAIRALVERLRSHPGSLDGLACYYDAEDRRFYIDSERELPPDLVSVLIRERPDGELVVISEAASTALLQIQYALRLIQNQDDR